MSIAFLSGPVRICPSLISALPVPRVRKAHAQFAPKSPKEALIRALVARVSVNSSRSLFRRRPRYAAVRCWTRAAQSPISFKGRIAQARGGPAALSSRARTAVERHARLVLLEEGVAGRVIGERACTPGIISRT